MQVGSSTDLPAPLWLFLASSAQFTNIQTYLLTYLLL